MRDVAERLAIESVAAAEIAASIADTYDRRGETVLRSPFLLRERDQDLIARATRQSWERALPPADRFAYPKFLDLCCGTGAFSLYPAKVGYQVWGVDLSAKSIAAAEMQAKVNGIDQLCRFEIGDVVEYLSAQTSGAADFPETFDVISICGSLYYLDISVILPLIYQRLAAGGVFLCLETNGSNLAMNWYRRWRNVWHHHRDPQTLSGLLRDRDYQNLQGYFRSVGVSSELVYLDFLTLLTPLFSRNRVLAERFHGWASRWDRRLLKNRFLQAFAFKLFLKAEKPAANPPPNLP